MPHANVAHNCWLLWEPCFCCHSRYYVMPKNVIMCIAACTKVLSYCPQSSWLSIMTLHTLSYRSLVALVTHSDRLLATLLSTFSCVDVSATATFFTISCFLFVCTLMCENVSESSVGGAGDSASDFVATFCCICSLHCPFLCNSFFPFYLFYHVSLPCFPPL